MDTKVRHRRVKPRVYRNENDVKAHVRQLLTEYGWKHWPNPAGPHSVAGIPDRCALKNGVFLAVECKGTGGKLTQHQATFLNEVRDNGGIATVVDPDSITAFTEWLKLHSADDRFAH